MVGDELAAFARQLVTETPKVLSRSGELMALAAADAYKNSVLKVQRREGVAGNRAKSLAKVGYDLAKDRQTVVLRMKSRMAHIMEEDTKAHTIAPKTQSTARSKKKRASFVAKKAMKFTFAGKPQYSRGPVQHPGTKGKYTFQRGVEAGHTDAVRAAANAVEDKLVKLWR